MKMVQSQHYLLIFGYNLGQNILATSQKSMHSRALPLPPLTMLGLNVGFVSKTQPRIRAQIRTTDSIPTL